MISTTVCHEGPGLPPDLPIAAAASRKLQGQYIAYIRQVPKGEQKKFAEIAKKNGREAAITSVKKLLGK